MSPVQQMPLSFGARDILCFWQDQIRVFSGILERLSLENNAFNICLRQKWPFILHKHKSGLRFREPCLKLKWTLLLLFLRSSLKWVENHCVSKQIRDLDPSRKWGGDKDRFPISFWHSEEMLKFQEGGALSHHVTQCPRSVRS